MSKLRLAALPKLLVLLSMSALVSSCATSSPPNARDFAVIPVVKVGSNSATGAEHIVRIPAQAPVPIRFRLEGGLLVAPISSTVEATFTRDIYLYKEWASFDGKVWKKASDLIQFTPSGDIDRSGVKLTTKLDVAKWWSGL